MPKTTRPKRKMPDRAERARPVSVDRVLPGAWATALDLAQGDTSRIQILSVAKVAVLTPNERRHT